MLLLLRRLKHQRYMNDEFRKYLAYAIGELLLVIVGILIALQIDNWNEDRQQRSLLQSYLENIAENMHDDLEELSLLRESRFRQLEVGTTYQFLRNREEYLVDEVFIVSQGIVLASREVFFTSNTSAYDVLRSSSLQGRLQGTGIDRLLSAYYDTVRRIELQESSHYEYVRSANREIGSLVSGGVEAFAFSNPSALTPERFKELQPIFRAVIQNPFVNSLIHAGGRLESIMRHYATLELLSQTLDEALSGRSWQTVESIPQTPRDRVRLNKGLPSLVEDGRVAYEYYWLGFVGSPGSEPFQYDSIARVNDALRVSHLGGAEWVSVYLSSEGADAIRAGRARVDFSEFSTLELEMKGAVGGEALSVTVKDADYPDELPPISVAVTLEKDWRTYTIDLADFAPNDLTAIHVPLGLNFESAREPATVFLRNARYR